MTDLSVKIKDTVLKNPVITASGTYGFGMEYDEYIDISKLGGISVKGLTLKERLGNPPPRIAETKGGILNSVGLQNPGVNKFIEEYLPFLKKKGLAVIANIAGSTVEDYEEMTEIISDSDTDMIEVNISCPNVKEGGVAFGTNPKTVFEITDRIKKKSKKPVIMKLSPNVTSIVETAKAAEAAGADVLSLINTLLGMKIDINTKRPVLYNNFGGLSGGAVMPVAVRMVYEVTRNVNVPVIGMGGIETASDAIEFLLAGASAVMVGTVNFKNPNAPLEIISGIEDYMDANGFKSIKDINAAFIMNGV